MQTQEPTFSIKYMSIWGGILIILLIISLIPLVWPHGHEGEYENPVEVDFSLPRADGGTFQLSDYRGEVVIVYFGYTQCPDVCPTTMYDFKQALTILEEDVDEVEVVFVTIDPANDTPDRLTTYLNAFNPNFIGLYGGADQLQAVYDIFDINIYSADQSDAGMQHTTSAFVIDRSGKLRLEIHFGTSPKNIANELESLLKEQM